MFSRGLRLVRVAVYVLLLQIAATIVLMFTRFGDSGDDWKDIAKWTQYLFMVNTAVTAAMCVGMLRAMPELTRARIGISGLVIAASAFAVATAALIWSYHTVSAFVDVASNPESSYDEVYASAESLGSLKTITVVKDISYAIGLFAMIRTAQRAAAINDQLALRDLAASMSRALLVMLIADVFYQLTYGLGGPITLVGLIGALLIAVYWLYCHVRLARFLYNAAYLFNEPHGLPVAQVFHAPVPAVRPSQPLRRPSSASVPPPLVIPQPPPPPTPRATSAAPSDDGPRLLR